MQYENRNEILLEHTTLPILENVRSEFTVLLSKLGGNDDLFQIADYLFAGYDCLKSGKKYEIAGFIERLHDTFTNLANAYRESQGVEPHLSGHNITKQVGQLVRFYNFVITLKNCEEEMYSRKKKVKTDYNITYLIRNFEDIKEFILINVPEWRPFDKNWGREFEWLEFESSRKRQPKNDNKGYETYYTTGVAEIIRTLYTKKKHHPSFEKNFNTDFEFYMDFPQLIGIYNLTLYSFIEIVETWTYVGSFIEKYQNIPVVIP